MGRALCLIGIASFVAGCGSIRSFSGPGPAQVERIYRIVSSAQVPSLPAGSQRLDLWMPIPSSDNQQTITSLKIDSALSHEVQTDPDYGNKILHVWSDHPMPATIQFSFECTRREGHASSVGQQENGPETSVPSDRLLQPDRLGVIDDQIRALAQQVTTNEPDKISKARAIYNYVIDHMAYDKITPGWGNGDTLRACAVGKGNCTDFSALSISLARASGIKARFKMGCQIPPAQHDGKIAGYHCWVEFWAPGTGWVPADASEAWKNPSRHDFYFGSLDADRVQFSWGRDVRLPGSAGEPLNYFFAPYAEVDGKPVQVDRSLMLAAAN